MPVKLPTEHHLDFISLKGAAQARLNLHLSKCHIVGNHMSRLKSIFWLSWKDDWMPWTEQRNMSLIFTFPIYSNILLDEVHLIHRGSYMSAHVLLNLLNKLGKRDIMRGLLSILSLYRNKFNKFNNTRAWMLDSIYHMTLRLLWNLISGVKTS